MSTLEVTIVTCDAQQCERSTDQPNFAWIIRHDLDLCPEHAAAILPPLVSLRDAPAAAPTAGTTSTEGITFALSGHDAVWVSVAMERHAYSSGTEHQRELIRELHALIEDYARSEP